MNTYIPMHLHFTVFHDLAVYTFVQYSGSVLCHCFTLKSGISDVNVWTANLLKNK